MRHDFETAEENVVSNLNFSSFQRGEKIGRVDSKGNPCTGVGGVMDYTTGTVGDKRQWSTCSIEDMTEMVNKYPTCLKEIDPNSPPTEISDAKTTHECNLNKLNPSLRGYEQLNYNGEFAFTLFINVVVLSIFLKVNLGDHYTGI